VFDEESPAVLRDAVDHANGVATPVSSLYAGDTRGGIGGGPSSPRPIPPPSTSSCGAKKRAVFVPIPWRPEFSYGVPGISRLWQFGDADDVRTPRVNFCDSRLGLLDPARATCENASTGHPNHEGAALFASAIIDGIRPFVAEWNAGVGPTIAAPPPPILLASFDAMPSLGQPSTVTVRAEDRRTHALVAGNVEVNGTVVAKTNTPFTYTFNCKVRALHTPAGVRTVQVCDEVVVTAQGYPNAFVGVVEVEP
jgi:hypothetical protein